MQYILNWITGSNLRRRKVIWVLKGDFQENTEAKCTFIGPSKLILDYMLVQETQYVSFINLM